MSKLRFKVAAGMRYSYFVRESREHGRERERQREAKRDGRVLFGALTH